MEKAGGLERGESVPKVINVTIEPSPAPEREKRAGQRQWKRRKFPFEEEIRVLNTSSKLPKLAVLTGLPPVADGSGLTSSPGLLKNQKTPQKSRKAAAKPITQPQAAPNLTLWIKAEFPVSMNSPK